MSQGFVRPGRAADVDAIAEIQSRTWQAAYASVLPRAALNEATGSEAKQQWRAGWNDAVTNPPSKRHAVLVATGAADGAPDDTVTGFAAVGPAEDADCLPATDGELLTLLVDPEYGRQGHGSRLLAAVADHLRAHGFVTAVSWVFADDAVTRRFLLSAGWDFDGAHRDLDMGEPVRQLRMHTSLT